MDYEMGVCAGGGGKLPRNLLYEWVEYELVEWQEASFASGMPNNKATRRAKRILLCSNCLKRRQDAKAEHEQSELRSARRIRRSQRRAALARILFKIIIFSVVLILIAKAVQWSQKVGMDSAAAPQSSAPQQVSRDAQPVAADELADHTAPQTRSEASAIVQTPDNAPSITPDNEPALYASVVRALDSGLTTRWRASEKSEGLVVVSQSQTSDDRECRAYRYTVSGVAKRWFDGTACRTGASTWQLGPPKQAAEQGDPPPF